MRLSLEKNLLRLIKMTSFLVTNAYKNYSGMWRCKGGTL
ncbi:hypothetical protein C2W58_00060 [Bacillus pumilus]|uniref:Uncharacterized protein n=1 Tax=Bacillus pumilus TaxID=1408 RepID=A0AB34QS92_BACPU|nr:hypothetical protein BAT_2695 [Bacillus pumilus ATCC 7061]KIL12568.1 hypothetical protein B4127_1899 [Bacillus pumilus]RAP16710.1 hypothetical protein C2W58_00060 [Bacillus pumilus]